MEDIIEKSTTNLNSTDISKLWDHYRKNKPVVDITEFREDINRFVYVKRLLRRYKNSGDLNVRLLINHLVVLYNVFDQLATTYIVKSSSKDIHDELFAVLIFLNRIPEDFDVMYNHKVLEILDTEVNGK